MLRVGRTIMVTSLCLAPLAVRAQEQVPADAEAIVGTADAAAVETMTVAGDSICKAFNGAGRFPCSNKDQEEFNWATSVTNDGALCTPGPDGVLSHAERIACLRGSNIIAAFPNHARSGAQMLTDFVGQAERIRDYLLSQPAPRYVPVLLGHNDVCGGNILKYNLSCPRGSDQAPNNYCRTTPAAFERELRRGLDILIGVPDTRIGLAAMVRVSQLCRHRSKQNCQAFGSCQDLWSAVAYTGWIFGRANGICGSVTVTCSNSRIRDGYTTAKSYRDVVQRVAEEYGILSPGSPSAVMTIAGQSVGGAEKAAGTTVVYSDAPWRYRFPSSMLNCCDCFHPSPAGQNAASRVLFEGLTCTTQEPCCADTGDALVDGKCEAVVTDGTFYPGLF